MSYRAEHCMKGRNRAAFSVLCMNNSFVSLSLGFAPILWPLSWALAAWEEGAHLAKSLREFTVGGKVPSPSPARALQGQTPLHQLTLFSPVQDVCAHPHSTQVEGHRDSSEQLQIMRGGINAEVHLCFYPFILLFLSHHSSCIQPEAELNQPVHPEAAKLYRGDTAAWPGHFLPCSWHALQLDPRSLPPRNKFPSAILWRSMPAVLFPCQEDSSGSIRRESKKRAEKCSCPW